MSERRGLGVLGVGAAACAACCVGPLLAFLGGLGVAGAAGTLLAGTVGLATVAAGGIALMVRRQRRTAACGQDAGPVPVAAPGRR